VDFADPSGLQAAAADDMRYDSCPATLGKDLEKPCDDLCKRIRNEKPKDNPKVCKQRDAGGTVFCDKNGNIKCICLYDFPFSDPQAKRDPETGRRPKIIIPVGGCKPLTKCACEHEKVHYDDPNLTCPKQAGINLVGSGTPRQHYQSECDAHKKEVECLNNIKPEDMNEDCNKMLAPLLRERAVQIKYFCVTGPKSLPKGQ
jgi:hypothetical protein